MLQITLSLISILITNPKSFHKVSTGKLLNQSEKPGDFETLPGFNGMFINGVELLNYKSDDTIFYGQIQELIVTTGGTGYDVVNPPRFTIVDTVGSVTGTVALKVLWKELIL